MNPNIGWRMMQGYLKREEQLCWRTKIEDLDERFGNGRKRCEEGSWKQVKREKL